MNPRAAINDLHPFQGCPFSLLGTSPDFSGDRLKSRRAFPIHMKFGSMCCCVKPTENVGFEPTVPFGITGFQDRPLKPLGQLSKERFAILTHRPKRVKPSFSFFCAASKPSREPSHTHIDQKNNPCYIRWEMTPASIGGG